MKNGLRLLVIGIASIGMVSNAYYTADDALVQQVNAIQAQLDKVKQELAARSQQPTAQAAQEAKVGESNVLADIFTDLVKSTEAPPSTNTPPSTSQSQGIDWASLAKETFSTLFSGQNANRPA